MRRRHFLALAAAAALVGGGGMTYHAYADELSRARARIREGARAIQGRFGLVEYGVAGEGAPVIMIHGTGGGFDQGLLFARRLVESGRQIIAPSRFGYLGSSFPSDPSSDNQADAIVDLMDALGLERAPVIGGSAGALSAIAFAIRHPGRCAALIAAVPATHAPDAPLAAPPGLFTTAIIENALRSNLLFWAGLQTVRGEMIRALLATDPAQVDAAEADEKARVDAILRGILPVSARANGILNDAALTRASAPMPIDRITAPTLAIGVQDDLFGTYAAARHIADVVVGARFLSFPTGGHIWVGRDKALFGGIARYLDDLGL